MGIIRIARYEENFKEIVAKEPGKLIVCGTAPVTRRFLPYLPKADFFWDVQGSTVSLDLPPISYEELAGLHEPLHILVCINDKTLFEEICSLLSHMDITATVFNIYYNCAFNFFRGNYSYNPQNLSRPLKVRIINYDNEGWILTKFAKRMCDNLHVMGIEAEIGSEADPTADINHHIPSHPYLPFAEYNDTLMITHIDCQYKVDLLRHQLNTARMGICMSRETMNMLAGSGIPRHKLCYVNPAHDANMAPKKYIMGITHKCHDEYDMRKRISALLDIVSGVNPDYFKFIIMGSGWQKTVDTMREYGLEVDYYPNFDYQIYHQIMPTLDYYLFFGYDEGSMGYLDALSAGVKTIVTPQGFHLDVPGGIDYACRTVDQFANTLYDLQFEREKKIASVAEWTWENYTRKHVEIWEYITGRAPLAEIYANQLCYEDGIFSCLISDNSV